MLIGYITDAHYTLSVPLKHYAIIADFIAALRQKQPFYLVWTPDSIH